MMLIQVMIGWSFPTVDCACIQLTIYKTCKKYISWLSVLNLSVHIAKETNQQATVIFYFCCFLSLSRIAVSMNFMFKFKIYLY